MSATGFYVILVAVVFNVYVVMEFAKKLATAKKELGDQVMASNLRIHQLEENISKLTREVKELAMSLR